MVKAKPRIAVVSSPFPPHGGGGVATSHYNLLKALQGKGYDARGFTFADAPASAQEQWIVRTRLPKFVDTCLGLGSHLYLRLRGERGVLYQFHDALTGAIHGLRLLGPIRRYRPDLIIAPDHGAPTAFWPVLEKSRIIFVSHHNSARFLNEALLGPYSVRDSMLGVRLERMAALKAQAVICPSAYMKDVFRRTYGFKGRVAVVPNLIDEATIASFAAHPLHDELGLSPAAPIVYVPSAGSRLKGRNFVFEILRRLAAGYPGEIGFYLSGALDPELARCLAFLPSNARVSARGDLSYGENMARVKSCSFCVYPTLIDNLSMAVLEAQCCALPVVTFDVGGMAEIVIDGETGFLLPFLDLEGLVGRSLQLLADRGRCAAFALKARATTVARFGEPAVLERFQEFAAAVLAEPLRARES